MRLANPLYESLPVLYIIGGAALLFGSYRLHSGPLSVLSMVAGGVGLIAGVAVWLRRRDFRATNAEYWANHDPNDKNDEDLT